MSTDHDLADFILCLALACDRRVLGLEEEDVFDAEEEAAGSPLGPLPESGLTSANNRAITAYNEDQHYGKYFNS